MSLVESKKAQACGLRLSFFFTLYIQNNKLRWVVETGWEDLFGVWKQWVGAESGWEGG
jgi:hypothetical protein